MSVTVGTRYSLAPAENATTDGATADGATDVRIDGEFTGAAVSLMAAKLRDPGDRGAQRVAPQARRTRVLTSPTAAPARKKGPT
jgi:hypothetical protein